MFDKDKTRYPARNVIALTSQTSGAITFGAITSIYFSLNHYDSLP